MKAVIYARYSSDSQREESIEGQLRECTEYAERNGITILRSYIDRALSARTADRPEFQNMIKDSEQKLFDVVLIWKLDRFSRDRYDSAHYKRILKKNGVKVVSVKENISDGPEGIILESMLEGYAEYYSAELSEKIQRGQRENALKCKNNGGNTPLGYVVGTDGVLAVDPLTAPLVTEIFTRYDSGESISEITASLNGRGLKTKKGKAFKIGGVSLILKNRKYIGEYQYGSVIIPKGIPAIIDDDLFDRVQRRMAFNKKAPAKAKATEEYLLTTKLFCGTCERLMAGESGTSSTKGVKHYYYKCGGAKRKLGCKRKAVRKHWIERAAVLVTVQRVLQDDEISRIAEAIVALQEKEDTSLPAMRQQLTGCEKAIDNMLNAIQMGVLTASIKERLEKLEMQREELKLSILQAQMARPRYTKEQVVSWISRFKYGNVDDPQYQKQIIDTFINSIYVFDDRLVFTYNFKDGTETITLAEIQAAFGSDLTQVAPPKPHFFGSEVFCFRQKKRPPAFPSEVKGRRRSCNGEEKRSDRQRGIVSRKQAKAHHGNTQHHEHHARCAVEGLGLRTVGKDCGDTRPEERENDAQHPCERIRQSPDGKVGNGAGQGGEGHDENARADGRFQLVAHHAREDEQHHHAAARADEAADHADHRAADERLHRALFRVRLRHRFLRGHHGAQDELDAQQERHEDGEAAHRRRGDEACRVAADDGEEQHARHHDESVFDVEILVFVVGVGRDGAREHIG